MFSLIQLIFLENQTDNSNRNALVKMIMKQNEAGVRTEESIV